MFLRVTYLKATERHLSYGITECYLPLDTGKRARQAGRYLIHLPWRDRKLS